MSLQTKQNKTKTQHWCLNNNLALKLPWQNSRKKVSVPFATIRTLISQIWSNYTTVLIWVRQQHQDYTEKSNLISSFEKVANLFTGNAGFFVWQIRNAIVIVYGHGSAVAAQKLFIRMRSCLLTWYGGRIRDLPGSVDWGSWPIGMRETTWG